MPSDRVFEIKDLVLTYDMPSGSCTATVYTDMPGGSMSSRATPSPGTTSGFKKKVFPLDGSGYLEGTMVKLKLDPTAAMKVKSGGFHVRPVGLYIDGANSEQWESQELSLGV